MKFPNIDAAQAWSTKHRKMIYVEIEDAAGVLLVYPGGRKVFVAADSPLFKRWTERLTPDSEFENGGAA